MKIQKFAIIFLMCLCLAGCSGISQDEYDSVISERDSLKTENENLKKIQETELKAIEYKTTIELEYEHDVFVINLIGKMTGTDVSEYVNGIEECYKTVQTFFEVSSFYNDLITNPDSAKYDSYSEDVANTFADELENVYNSWNDVHTIVEDLEKSLNLSD